MTPYEREVLRDIANRITDIIREPLLPVPISAQVLSEVTRLRCLTWDPSYLLDATERTGHDRF